MTTDTLADFFMPQDRKNGEDLLNKDVVSIASSSDTQANAYVKVSGAPRVSFTTDEISSSSFQADCTCTAAKKGKLCKHMWATLLKLEAIDSDFLACKSIVEKAPTKPQSTATLSVKARQAEYNQQQKGKNKARNKKIRDDKKQAKWATASAYPDDIQAALDYFISNGFELTNPIQLSDLSAARKTLARIFHPDKGGTHEEILMLNKNHDIIANYLGN